MVWASLVSMCVWTELCPKWRNMASLGRRDFGRVAVWWKSAKLLQWRSHTIRWLTYCGLRSPWKWSLFHLLLREGPAGEPYGNRGLILGAWRYCTIQMAAVWEIKWNQIPHNTLKIIRHAAWFIRSQKPHLKRYIDILFEVAQMNDISSGQCITHSHCWFLCISDRFLVYTLAFTVYNWVPQIQLSKATVLQSLAPIIIKDTWANRSRSSELL